MSFHKKIKPIRFNATSTPKKTCLYINPFNPSKNIVIDKKPTPSAVRKKVFSTLDEKLLILKASALITAPSA
jgi:hypothetical protein